MCKNAKLWTSGKMLINSDMYIILATSLWKIVFIWLQDGYGFKKSTYVGAYLLKRTRRFDSSSTRIGVGSGFSGINWLEIACKHI